MINDEWKFSVARSVIVFKNNSYDFIKEKTNGDEIYVAIIKSGQNFERIRFDEELIKKIHLFECTNDMDINQIIKSTTKGKTIKKIY